MELTLDAAEVFVPDGLEAAPAVARTTHLAVGAHPDDVEIMACDGILSCFLSEHRWFCGVVMSDGARSPRRGPYRHLTDQEMASLRRHEQKTAAVVGRYGAQVLLGYPSETLKDATRSAPVRDLMTLLSQARPQVVYTHNLADNHDTHVATALRVIEALRGLPAASQPDRLYGCEVWRDLDWLVDDEKVAFDLSALENLQQALLGVFDSQISGGKRYDLATMARRRAHATYYASHEPDLCRRMAFAMDLTSLIKDPSRDVRDYIQEAIAHFAQDVTDRIARMD